MERAGDNAGAIIGPLLAADLVSMIGIRQAILLSIIPGEASTGSNQAWTEIHESVDQQLAQHPPIAENG